MSDQDKKHNHRKGKNFKKRRNRNYVTYAAILIGVVIVAFTILLVYSGDQAKIKGEAFGKALEFIQDDLKKTTQTFHTSVTMLKEENMSKKEFSERAKIHEDTMTKIILRYDGLLIPKSFVPAVELFKLSSEAQLASDLQMIECVLNNNNSACIRSDSLWQESFEYEMAALSKFKLAQGPLNP